MIACNRKLIILLTTKITEFAKKTFEYVTQKSTFSFSFQMIFQYHFLYSDFVDVDKGSTIVRNGSEFQQIRTEIMLISQQLVK